MEEEENRGEENKEERGEENKGEDWIGKEATLIIGLKSNIRKNLHYFIFWYHITCRILILKDSKNTQKFR